MKTTLGLLVLALCISLTATAQVFPNGGCGCGLSGTTMSCDCAEAVYKNKQSAPSEPSQLIETLLTLSPGALLTKGILGDDEVFIGMGIGRLVNEAKSPPLAVPIGKGSIFLMPKDEPYRLRNVGTQNVEVRVIRIHHIGSARQ